MNLKSGTIGHEYEYADKKFENHDAMAVHLPLQQLRQLPQNKKKRTFNFVFTIINCKSMNV